MLTKIIPNVFIDPRSGVEPELPLSGDISYFAVKSLRRPIMTPAEIANVNTMVDITIPKGDVGTPPSQLTQMAKAAKKVYSAI